MVAVRERRRGSEKPAPPAAALPRRSVLNPTQFSLSVACLCSVPVVPWGCLLSSDDASGTTDGVCTGGPAPLLIGSNPITRGALPSGKAGRGEGKRPPISEMKTPNSIHLHRPASVRPCWRTAATPGREREVRTATHWVACAQSRFCAPAPLAEACGRARAVSLQRGALRNPAPQACLR